MASKEQSSKPQSPKSKASSINSKSKSPSPNPELAPDDIEDGDSVFDDAATSTASLRSSIFEYRQLHGRTYHNHGKTEYWGPNDQQQNEQLEIGHHMMTLLLDDEIYLAPLGNNIGKVLDVGTGTGIWACDFADQHPESVVIGTDLSPIQPTWIPPNVKFEIDDAQLDWTFEEETLDYVHSRCLMGSIDNWPRVFGEAFRCLKPGGYIEIMEMDIQALSDDGTVGPGDTLYEWSQLFINAGETMGRTFKIPRQAKQLIEDAGFVDVVEKKWKVPIGGWAKDPKMKAVGTLNQAYLLEGLEGMALFILTNVLKWTYEEIQVYIANMRKAIKDPKNHAYYEIVVVYGRKP